MIMAPWLITTWLPMVSVIQVVQPYALADPAVVADRKLPWELDVHTGMDHHTLSHFRAEQAQQAGLGERKGNAGFKKNSALVKYHSVRFTTPGTGIEG